MQFPIAVNVTEAVFKRDKTRIDENFSDSTKSTKELREVPIRERECFIDCVQAWPHSKSTLIATASILDLDNDV